MRQYRGIQTEHGYAVLVEDGAESCGLDPNFSLRSHSPSGFAWGYAGSGPAQLALAICADALGDDDRALAAYQTFKFRVIAYLPAGGWVLSEREVLEHLAAIERERVAVLDDPRVIEEPVVPPARVPPLARRIDRHLAALAAHRGEDETERLAVMRERGWQEAVRHFAALGELTHVGRAEAEKLVAASVEWLREQRGEPAEGIGR